MKTAKVKMKLSDFLNLGGVLQSDQKMFNNITRKKCYFISLETDIVHWTDYKYENVLPDPLPIDCFMVWTEVILAKS